MKNKPKFAKELAKGIIDYLDKKKAKDSLPLVLRYLKEEINLGFANIYAPKKFTKSEQVQMKKLVKKIVGEEINKLNFYEDESLIDGIRILYKDKLWDMSLSSQLNSFGKQ